MHYFKKCSIFLFLFLFILLTKQGYAQVDYFQNFKESLLSYFPIITGKVIKLENNELTFDKGAKDGIKKGQRVVLLKKPCL